VERDDGASVCFVTHFAVFIFQLYLHNVLCVEWDLELRLLQRTYDSGSIGSTARSTAAAATPMESPFSAGTTKIDGSGQTDANK